FSFSLDPRRSGLRVVMGEGHAGRKIPSKQINYLRAFVSPWPTEGAPTWALSVVAVAETGDHGSPQHGAGHRQRSDRLRRAAQRHVVAKPADRRQQIFP